MIALDELGPTLEELGVILDELGVTLDELLDCATEELDTSPEELDSTLEELNTLSDELDDSATEELDSPLEELRTALEELDASSEELDSALEELNTVSDELLDSSSAGPVAPSSPSQPHNSIANASPGNRILCMIALLSEYPFAAKIIYAAVCTPCQKAQMRERESSVGGQSAEARQPMQKEKRRRSLQNILPQRLYRK